jgi:ATP-dependent protease ClpP protease subunit
MKIYLYSDIMDDSPNSSSAVAAQLEQAGGEAVEVHINSCGGSVYEGFTIYNLLRNYKGGVTIYIDGIAASIAGVIAMCGAPIYMSRYAHLMVHVVSASAYGSVKDFERMMKQMLVLQSSIVKIISERTGMSEEDVSSKYMDGEDHYINAEEAQKMGLIEGIYDDEGGLPPDASDITSVYNFVNNLRTRSMLFDDIKKVGAFSNCATEQDIVSKAQELAGVSGKAAILEAENRELKKKLADAQEARLQGIVDEAVRSGKIEECNKGAFLAMLKADEANAVKFLENLKAKTVARATDFIKDGTQPNEFENKTWEELDKAGKLVELKEQNPELFKSLYKKTFGVDYK